MKPTQPAEKLKVTPPASWALHSPYGVLQDMQRNPLVRLEDVHAFLMERDGLSSSDAAVRVFGAFTSSGNSELGMKHGADKLRPFLMLCDRADKAYALFPSSKYAVRTHLEKLEELVPYVPHHHFDRGTPEGLLHSLGEMAGEVWSPVGGDFDLNDRPLAAFVDDGYFPSVAVSREILGALAVRHELAHQLWGWGAVGAAVGSSGDSQETASAANSELQASFVFSSEFTNLCTARKDRKGDSWEKEEKDTLWKEISSFSNRAHGLRASMALALGLKDAEAVSKLVRGMKRVTGASVTVVKAGKKVA